MASFHLAGEDGMQVFSSAANRRRELQNMEESGNKDLLCFIPTTCKKAAGCSLAYQREKNNRVQKNLDIITRQFSISHSKVKK